MSGHYADWEADRIRRIWQSVAMHHTCPQCTKPFQARARLKFCSQDCYWDSMRYEVHARPCEHCGVEFTPLGKFPDQRFCSVDCSAKVVAPRGEAHYSYRGPIRKAGDGYLARAGSPRMLHAEVWHDANPNGVCEDCGGTVQHVHHIDEDRHNNDLANLAGLCARCHRHRHRKSPTPCGVDTCERDARARGLCMMHYKRWKTHGDPHLVGRNTGAIVWAS